MPTYEYRCKDCDHQFDIQQAFTDFQSGRFGRMSG